MFTARLGRNSNAFRNGIGALSAVGAGVVAAVLNLNQSNQQRTSCDGTKALNPPDEDVDLINYSGTHELTTSKLYVPETIAELEKIVANSNMLGQKIRPVGTFLSPNGIASSTGGMLSMVQCDRVLNVDVENKLVTVEAGIVVGSLMDTITPHGLTLENFSSIKDQQMAGWCQVGAHGTGATLSTVEEMITTMKIVTPAKGTLTLSADAETEEERELFRLARCGLGSLGIVSEMTLKCIPSHRLYETTHTTTALEIRTEHAALLQDHRHVRYMWPPYTDNVIKVVSDVVTPDFQRQSPTPHDDTPIDSLLPMKQLLIDASPSPVTLDSLSPLNFAALRDRLIDLNPLDTDHVIKCTKAEVEFWKHVPPREEDSAAILGFDCGGQQWVLELALPCGTLTQPSLEDLDFIAELKAAFEAESVPAHFPIEQRWTSSSSSYMSPAYSENPDALFTWVGIIMYMPTSQSVEERQRITEHFRKYASIMQQVGDKYGAFPHWAKIELPPSDDSVGDSCELTETLKMRQMVRNKFDVDRFNKARLELDPKGILSNRLIETLFDN